MSVVERARLDVEQGRLWKARDRLTGTLQQRPHEAEVIDLLGDVYLRMGDPPAAGRILMLSAREDEAARKAREAFTSLHQANVYYLAAAVPAKRPLDRYPDPVQGRLAQLAEAVMTESGEVAWARTATDAENPAIENGKGGLLIAIALGMLFILPWLIGLIYIVSRLAARIF